MSRAPTSRVDLPVDHPDFDSSGYWDQLLGGPPQVQLGDLTAEDWLPKYGSGTLDLPAPTDPNQFAPPFPSPAAPACNPYPPAPPMVNGNSMQQRNAPNYGQQGLVNTANVNYGGYNNFGNKVNIHLPAHLAPQPFWLPPSQGGGLDNFPSNTGHPTHTSGAIPAGYPHPNQMAPPQDVYGHPHPSRNHQGPQQLPPSAPMLSRSDGTISAPRRRPASCNQPLPKISRPTPTPAQAAEWYANKPSTFRPLAPAAPVIRNTFHQMQEQTVGGAIELLEDGGRSQSTPQISKLPVKSHGAKPLTAAALAALGMGPPSHTKEGDATTSSSNDDHVPLTNAARNVDRLPPRFHSTAKRTKIHADRTKLRKAASQATGAAKTALQDELSITVTTSNLRIHDRDHALSIVEERKPLTENANEGLDWTVIHAERDIHLASLLDALNAALNPIPDDAWQYTTDGMAAFLKWQQSHHDKNRDQLAGHVDDSLYAEACCVLLWEHMLDLYRDPHGIRIFDRKVNAGPDCNLNWRQRLAAMIANIKKFQIVGYEVLTCQRLPEFVANPNAFGKQKENYFWINVNKPSAIAKPPTKKTETQLKQEFGPSMKPASAGEAEDASSTSDSTETQQSGGAPQVPLMIATPPSSIAAVNAAPKKKSKTRSASEAFDDEDSEYDGINKQTSGPAKRALKKSKASIQPPATPSVKKTVAAEAQEGAALSEPEASDEPTATAEVGNGDNVDATKGLENFDTAEEVSEAAFAEDFDD